MGEVVSLRRDQAVALPMLIFDGDCAFCTRGAQLARRLRPDVAVVPWQQVPLADVGLTAQQAAASLQWIAFDGTVSSGAGAVAALCRGARGPLRWVGAMLGAPLVRSAAASAYRVVAANRYRLPGGTPACVLPDERRGKRRCD